MTLSETRAIVEDGLTIDGKSLREQSEAINLNVALDFIEDLSKNDTPLTQREIKEIHTIVLKDISNEAGCYRKKNVRITGSTHRPPEAIFINEEMDRLEEWLESTTLNPILLAAIVHTWFVTIHPFIDGNGRTARLLLNLILMRNGYPIALIKKEQRPEYYDSLEESHTGDITKLVQLVYRNVLDTLREYQRMIAEDKRAEEELTDIAEAIQLANHRRKRAEYDIWKSSMELLKAQFSINLAKLEQQISNTHKINLQEYLMIDFDKYSALCNGETAKATWFFGVQIAERDSLKRERFMFYFGTISNSMSERYTKGTSLYASRFKDEQYKRLADDPISIREVVSTGDSFGVLEYDYMSQSIDIKKSQRASNIALKFVKEVMNNYFINR